jgi:integrase
MEAAMASLQRRSTGIFLLAFAYAGRRFLRSLETHDEQEAETLKTLIEHRLKQLRDGILVLSDGAAADDLWGLLRSGRLPTPPHQLVRSVALERAISDYLASYPTGSKEPATLDTERAHLNNLQRILPRRQPLHDLSPSDLRTYIRRRQQETGQRGGKIKPDTIRKELQTFRLLWSYARDEGFVAGECPIAKIKLPKRRQKLTFQTWEQIESRIGRGGLTQQQIAELWECLFLSEREIGEFLQHVADRVKDLPRFPYIFPALCFCAYTGARRSEMFRCQIDDLDGRWILIREKKRDKDTEWTFRHVPMSRQLQPIVDAWLSRHPGGQYLFSKNGGQPLDDRTSREAFKAVVKGSRWRVLRGYHVLRHSFASNLARTGRVCQAEIDDLMGHQTEEMRLRYRHLFPEDKRRAVDVLDYAQSPT